MRRSRRYDVVAELAAKGARLRARREEAAADLAAEREADARLEDERKRARDAEWADQCRAERQNADILPWRKGAV